MSRISKEEFIRIIKRLEETEKTKNEIDKIIKESTDCIISDFTNASSLMICHEDIVISLLETMFDDKDTISWWIYDLEYGKKYEDGCITEKDGTIIDLSTTEKLYDFLISEK